MDLRALGLLSSQTQPTTIAATLYEWHRNNLICPRCGERTTPDRAGIARRCPKCGQEFFPRTDPAVILAMTDPVDRLLLMHVRDWPGNRVSVQAGFIEAGESMEQACHREIQEETGLAIRSLGLFGTQPWPFSRSLMLGLGAGTDGAEPNLDDEELSRDFFHTREGLRRAVAEGELTLPGPASLVRQLIEAWPARGG